jgi:hypothetical protein
MVAVLALGAIPASAHEADDRGDPAVTQHQCRLQWADLESFQYDLDRYDPIGRLAIAEGDRRHALHFWHVTQLSPRLEREFQVARRQAPRAASDLAGALAPAATASTRGAVRRGGGRVPVILS